MNLWEGNIVHCVCVRVFARSKKSQCDAVFMLLCMIRTKKTNYCTVQYCIYIALQDNYLSHGPRAQAEYHHGFEHCI
jgi:hypothetical protein